MKNANNTNGNRTRDLPACSAVPQPTAPPRAPIYLEINKNLKYLTDLQFIYFYVIAVNNTVFQLDACASVTKSVVLLCLCLCLPEDDPVEDETRRRVIIDK